MPQSTEPTRRPSPTGRGRHRPVARRSLGRNARVLVVAGAVIAAVAVVVGMVAAGSGSAADRSERTNGHGTSSVSSPAAVPPNGGGTKLVRGTIRVLIDSGATTAFTTLAQQFEQRYPGTTVTLWFGTVDQLRSELRAGHADVVAADSSSALTSLDARMLPPQSLATRSAVTSAPAAAAVATAPACDATCSAQRPYPMAVLQSATNPTVAQAWVQFVQGPAGRLALASVGH